jgi:hypothetical protein
MGRHDGCSLCYFFDVMRFVCVIYERIAGRLEAMKRDSFAQGFASPQPTVTNWVVKRNYKHVNQYPLATLI